MTTTIETHPVQTNAYRREGARVPQAITMAAYEVYCHVWAPQSALIEGDCRGGFGAGELVAFLYARSFPKAEWKARFQEACRGMVNL
jgi:hypothetical protein